MPRGHPISSFKIPVYLNNSNRASVISGISCDLTEENLKDYRLRCIFKRMKKKQIKVDAFSRLMIYILGHGPDEFGLVPDKKGFVTYKELLQAIHE